MCIYIYACVCVHGVFIYLAFERFIRGQNLSSAFPIGYSHPSDCIGLQVKWFTDGAQFNTDHEMIIWLWSSTMSMKNWCTKFPFAVIPMRFLPTKDLRVKANRAITEAIAWDSSLAFSSKTYFTRDGAQTGLKQMA